jgi:hypothetical protein
VIEENNGQPVDSEANAGDVQVSPRSNAGACPQQVRRHGDRFILLKMFPAVKNGMVSDLSCSLIQLFSVFINAAGG